MPNIVAVNGKVILKSTAAPLPSINIQFWNADPAVQVVVGNAQTDLSGGFHYEFDVATSDAITNQGLKIRYRIFDTDNTLLVEGPIESFNEPIVIQVGKEALNNLTIKGIVKDAAGRLLIKPVIRVFAQTLQDKRLLAVHQDIPDGNFRFDIRDTLLQQPETIKPALVIEVATSDDLERVVATATIIDWQAGGEVQVELKAEIQNDQSAHDALKDSVSQIAAGINIHELTDEHIDFVASRAGASATTIRTLIESAKAADSSGLPIEYFYAVAQASNFSIEALKTLKPKEVSAIVSKAVNENIIPKEFHDNLNAFLPQLKTYQVAETKAIQIPGETHTLNDVLSSIFPTESDTDTFLSHYHSDHDTMTEFWDDVYGPAVGEETKNKAIQGLKLATMAGFQPEIVSRLSVAIEGMEKPHLSQLAKWSADDWNSLVATACSDTGTLCVPAGVRGEETDHENTAIQEQYAARLQAILQASFPMTSVAGSLEGADGNALISDDTTRQKVADFINAHPHFDLRKHSVTDINPDDHDIAEEDVHEVRTALEPFQRVVRLVDGNPAAMTTLIADGIHSARALVDMGKETFLEQYGHLFPPDADAEVTASFSARYASGLSLGLPSAGTVLGSAYSVSAATAIGLTGSLTSSSLSIPGLPATFPGGFTTMPADNPVLSALFGNMDYCQCCDCKSVLSPTAYLSDQIHFLKTHSVATDATRDIYGALKDKRPDIMRIDLTCKNTDTPIPYIDLVTELLELQILKPIAGTYITGATAASTLQIVLKPAMAIDTAALTTGAPTYQFTLKGTSSFINVNPISAFTSLNPFSYFYMEDYATGGTPGFKNATVSDAPGKRISWVLPTTGPDSAPIITSGGSSFMVWRSLSGVSGDTSTATFVDTAGNKATFAPFMFFAPSTGALTALYIPDITVEAVALTSTGTKIRVTRSHPAFTGTNLFWSLGGLPSTADPAAPGDPNRIILDLAPGTYKIGVSADYTHYPGYSGGSGDDPELPGESYISIVIRITPPGLRYLPCDFDKFSFQTSGTKEQLLAYPERTYKDADGNYQDFTRYAGGVPYQWGLRHGEPWRSSIPRHAPLQSRCRRIKSLFAEHWHKPV